MRYILFFFPFVVALSQPQEPAASPAPAGIEAKLSISWYQPNLDPLNQAYANLEHELGFRPWGYSSIPYFLNLEAFYPLFPQQSLVFEFGGAFTRRVHQEDRSLTSLWRGGVGYRYRFLEDPLRVSAQGTVGYIREEFTRSYNAGDQSINVAKNSWYFSVLGAASYPVFESVSIELTAGYMFVNSVTIATPEAEADLKAFMIGLGIVVPIF
jgi:hypothetical protein